MAMWRSIVEVLTIFTLVCELVLAQDPCVANTVIDDGSRTVLNKLGILQLPKCDNTLPAGNGWYRFKLNGKDIRIPNSCPSPNDLIPNKCGTTVAGWYSGPIPAQGSIASGTLCGNYFGCCNSIYSLDGIQVKNCGSYLVYNLREIPLYLCNFRYCIEDDVCSQSKVLDASYRRFSDRGGLLNFKVDTLLAEGWYRFKIGDTFASVATSPAPNAYTWLGITNYVCSTPMPAWYKGRVPTEVGEEAVGTLCWQTALSDCTIGSPSLTIKNCGTFFSYYIKSPGAVGICSNPVADNCISAPCQNGGACKNAANSYSCECNAGYGGGNCQTVTDPCVSKPCLNGAACTSKSGGFSCTCANGYTGNNCEAIKDNCASSPCKNGAKCTSSLGKFTCSCVDGYTGDDCGSVKDNCASSPCKNGAKCTSSLGKFTCTCAAGFTGADCSSAIPSGPCYPNPCKNDGVCSASGSDYECDCPADYNDGEDCSTYQNPCDTSPCQHGSTCVRLSALTFSCKCTDKYYGTFCELEQGKEPCFAQPCINGGTCKNTSPSTYQCTCPKKYEGLICEKVRCIDEASQAACANLAYGKYALCGAGNCNYWVACRAKKWKKKSCLNRSPNIFFNRAFRNCTATTSSCEGLPGY